MLMQLAPLSQKTPFPSADAIPGTPITATPATVAASPASSANFLLLICLLPSECMTPARTKSEAELCRCWQNDLEALLRMRRTLSPPDRLSATARTKAGSGKLPHSARARRARNAAPQTNHPAVTLSRDAGDAVMRHVTAFLTDLRRRPG